MGRSPCCEKVGLKKGPWTPEEDQKLLAYVEEHGHGNWRALPSKAGLQRCGKSCRLRWTNYLRPDIKRGKFSLQEEQTIIQLHALLGNRWSAIATHLPKRTDNEIKNYWNTHLKKRLTKMGIDPVTHKPKNDALLSHDGARSKSAANLSHMAQWESARLEAEARLARQSKMTNITLPPPPSPQPTPTRCIDVLRALRLGAAGHSPTSTLSFSENRPTAVIEFMGSNEHQEGQIKEEGSCEGVQDEVDDGMGVSLPAFTDISSSSHPMGGFIEGFTELLLCNFSDRNMSLDDGDDDGCAAGDCGGTEDNKSYWNSILNLVNSPPSSSPLF